MNVFVWNPEWETGIERIDAQHQALLEQLDSLVVAVRSKEAEERIPRLLRFLASYVDSHFRDEEMAMVATEYDGLAVHRQIHQELQAKVTSLLNMALQDSSAVTEPVLEFLVDWLVDHLDQEDRKMARHIIQWAQVHSLSDLPDLMDLRMKSQLPTPAFQCTARFTRNSEKK